MLGCVEGRGGIQYLSLNDHLQPLTLPSTLPSTLLSTLPSTLLPTVAIHVDSPLPHSLVNEGNIKTLTRELLDYLTVADQVGQGMMGPQPRCDAPLFSVPPHTLCPTGVQAGSHHKDLHSDSEVRE